MRSDPCVGARDAKRAPCLRLPPLAIGARLDVYLHSSQWQNAMAEVEAIGPSSLGLMLFEERWTDWIGECSDTAFGEPDTAGESLSGVAIARLAA